MLEILVVMLVHMSPAYVDIISYVAFLVCILTDYIYWWSFERNSNVNRGIWQVSFSSGHCAFFFLRIAGDALFVI